MKTLIFLLCITQTVTVYSQRKQLGVSFAKAPQQEWKFSTNGPITSAPVIDGINVYVTSYDSSVYCLNKENGGLIWKYKTNGYVASTPLLYDGVVIVYSGDGVLYGIDKKSGKVKWRFRTMAGALPDRKYDWADYYQSSPIQHEGQIYFGSGDGRVYAVDALTGTLTWFFKTEDIIHTSPAIANGVLYVGSFDGHLYALNKNSGNLIWKFKTTGQRYFPRGEVNGSPVVHNGLVYFGSRDFNFYALDAKLGFCHWLKSFPRGWSLPVTPNDSIIYLGTSDDRVLLAMDAGNGTEKWRTNLNFNIFGGMAIAHKIGVVGTLNGRLYAIDLNDGKVLWSLATASHNANRLKYFKEDGSYRDDIQTIIKLGDDFLKLYRDLGGIFSRPVVEGKQLLFTSYDGTVYSFRALD